MEKVVFGVPGIDQEGGDLIEKRLERLPGVQSVTVWMNEQQIDVSYDRALISAEDLVSTIQDLGYLAKHVQWSQRAPG